MIEKQVIDLMTSAASGCLWFQSKADSCKVIVNSATADHAKKVMFVGMRKVMRFPCAGRDGKELVSTPSENKYMSIANPLSGEGFSGQHSDATLFIFDEATGTATSESDWNAKCDQVQAACK